MSIIVTNIPIVNGGNFVYSPEMNIGSSNNKPLNLLVDGVKVVELNKDYTLIKNTLSFNEESILLPDENNVGVITKLYGSGDKLLTADKFVEINIDGLANKLVVPYYVIS